MADPFAEAQREREPGRRQFVGKVADLLERSGIDPDSAGRVKGVGVWQQMFAKVVACPECLGVVEEGNPCPACGGTGKKRESEVVDMVGVRLSTAELEDPEWPVVQQAKPCVVKHSNRAPKVRSGAHITALLPDPQIGYRRLDTGELIPLHDEQAMACALELLSVIKPDRIIWLGDHIDAAEWSSKFLVLPEFVLTTQPMVDRAHRFLAECVAAAGPQCVERDLLEGNHDNRLPIAIAKNAMAALRLRQANAPESWPVMSVPHLLRLDELGIHYVSGYPAGRLQLADQHGAQAPIYALHGEKLSMEKQAKAERVSTVQGHAHHFSMHAETFDLGSGQAVDVESWSLGCLCRRDGAVPSTKGGTDVRGRHVERIESWQHGIGVLVEDEESWELQPVRIRDGRARWGQTVVTAPEET